MAKTIIDKLSLTPDRLLNTRKITRRCAYLTMGMILAAVIIAKCLDYYEVSGDFADLILVLVWLGVLVVAVYAMSISNKHRVVCKALAGLELHQYHSAEDLVFSLGIEYDLAESIINGDYDCLLMDRLTCYFIH